MKLTSEQKGALHRLLKQTHSDDFYADEAESNADFLRRMSLFLEDLEAYRKGDLALFEVAFAFWALSSRLDVSFSKAKYLVRDFVFDNIFQSICKAPN